MSLQLRYTASGQGEQVIPLTDPPLIMGTLLSNQVVLRAAGVEPIHALIEDVDGQLMLTDLGSSSGVKLNGKVIEVESPLSEGDKITIGKIEMVIEPLAVEEPVAHPANLPKPPGVGAVSLAEGTPPKSIPAPETSSDVRTRTQHEPTKHSDEEEDEISADSTKRTVKSPEVSGKSERRRDRKDILFSPRKARPSGDVLEVVAYWDDRILDVDLFHPSLKDYDRVTLGDVPGAHFIAAGPDEVKNHTLAKISSGGYKVRLLKGMEARMRRGGKVETHSGPGSHQMGPRDIAHIKYGPVRYFLLFIKPPSIRLPRSGPRDPVLATLLSIAALFYLITVPYLWLSSPTEMEDEESDIWKIVNVVKKQERPKPIPRPKDIVQKTEIKIADVKKDPPTPPKPPPKPPQAVKPKEVDKVKQPKPVEKPVPVKKATTNLASSEKDQEQKKASAIGGEKSKQPDKGMASTGAKKPDFKRAGPRTANNASPKTGGAKGSGNNQKGGARKGKSAVSTKGVEGPKNNRASGVNLSKLGLGVGKILNKTGPGAIKTPFKSSAGGAGGGSGSASRNYGLGGIGKSSSLGLAGSGNAVNNFGSGSGGLGSGEGGSGGLGGAGFSGKGRGGRGGRGQANVNVPASDAVVGGGLTRSEILAVIRANLNQIRACYEQLLQRSPKAQGKLTVRFNINAGGRVSSIGIAGGTISDNLMRGCVTGKIRRWKFPKPRGASSVEVKYPFVFTPL